MRRWGQECWSNEEDTGREKNRREGGKVPVNVAKGPHAPPEDDVQEQDVDDPDRMHPRSPRRVEHLPEVREELPRAKREHDGDGDGDKLEEGHTAANLVTRAA